MCNGAVLFYKFETKYIKPISFNTFLFVIYNLGEGAIGHFINIRILN